MTLTITIVAPWGVWQCSDHRIIEIDENNVITWFEDLSVKHVQLRYHDGAALITYTGLGKWGDVHVSDWLRHQVRNESRTIDQALIRLRDGATAKFGPPLCTHGESHTFSVGAFVQGRPWLYLITNQSASSSWPRNHFVIEPFPADDPKVAVRGGGREAISTDDLALLERMRVRRPRRPKAYLRVLAAIHRRAKRSNHPARELISQGCRTAFLPPLGNDRAAGTGIEELRHWSDPDSDKWVPAAPFVLVGFDFTDHMRVLEEADRGMRAGQQLEDEELNRRMREATRRAFEPPT